MKKTILKITLCVACLAAAFYWNNRSVDKISDLTMSNIEALAGGEIDRPYYCAGEGSVECHGIKVEFKLEGYSL